ncbi:MAG: hypothetical protein ACE5R3_04200 [Nitrosopumilaceae archaeon]
MANISAEKINFQKVAPFIALSFAVGFGVATGAYFFIFCDDCFTLPTISSTGLTPEEKCDGDSRCILAPPIEPEPEISAIGMEKISQIEKIVTNPIIQMALKESNNEFSQMSPNVREQIVAQREKEWALAPSATPFMLSIINNDVADFLRNNLVIPSNEFGDIVFGEHILSNIYGPNVAVTVRTDNYDQSNDDWWQESKIIGRTLVRQCDFDESAQMYSEDIVVKIFADSGEFIGIMNSATPCDVTQVASETKTRIEPVPFENITPIGKYKISFLQELMHNPTIQEALSVSNEEFSTMSKQDLVTLKQDTEWPKPGIGEPTPLQLSILQNDVSDIMRENLKVKSNEFGLIHFPEMILTNAQGVNVASTERTFNYVQSQDEWWQVAVENDVLVRECGWDISIQMTSEDIVISIFDENDQFVGVLNSATSCDVILNKSPTFYGDSN